MKRDKLAPEEERFIEYLRAAIAKATPESDVALVVDPGTWTDWLTWALDRLESLG